MIFKYIVNHIKTINFLLSNILFIYDLIRIHLLTDTMFIGNYQLLFMKSLFECDKNPLLSGLDMVVIDQKDKQVIPVCLNI